MADLLYHHDVWLRQEPYNACVVSALYVILQELKF